MSDDGAAGEPQGGDTGMDMERSSTKRRPRVYERWEGNERFFLWGYLVAGPNWRSFLGTSFLIAAPAGIFLAFVAPYLMWHVSVAIMVFSCLLPALSILWLFLTACRDPGIIPRQEPDQEYLEGRKPRTKEVLVNNQRVVIRYNDTCHFYQPPRAHHCSVNDNCIERFDHHCPWVGTTIGKRNYRTFLLFVYTATTLCLYVFGCCLAQLFIKHNQLVDEAEAAGESTDVWGKTISKVIPAIALMAYTFLFFWFVGGLSVFHCYLVGSNQTTYENFRYSHDSRPNPYNRGLLLNCAEVWCVPIPKSQVPFRAYLDEWHQQRAAAAAAVSASNGVGGHSFGGSTDEHGSDVEAGDAAHHQQPGDVSARQYPARPAVGSVYAAMSPPVGGFVRNSGEVGMEAMAASPQREAFHTPQSQANGTPPATNRM